jgi:L-alanine-DL-glutamate epimerase-like enolase superfamily enzyme
MLRRTFLSSISPLAAGGLLFAARPEPARITRIRVAPAQGHFHKFVAMNAYDKAPKGRTFEHALIRIETNRGVEGIGAGTYAKPDDALFAALKKLIGEDPVELLQIQNGRVSGPSDKLSSVLDAYAHLDCALFDLAGKLLNKPVWQLIGDSVRDRVEAYDSTLYFSDVLHPDKGVAAVVDECKETVRTGYSALKFKLGRNFKWMPGDAGRQRDIEVVHAVRTALGSNIRIMADPNNGYRGSFDEAWNLLEKTREDNLYWIEELFPESVAGYTRLKDKMAEAGMKTLNADGENFNKPSQFEEYLHPRRLIDVLQLDIRRGGFFGIMKLSHLGEEAGAVTIPHNWASQIGLLMAMHLSKAVKAVRMIEDDRSKLDALVPAGYEFSGGAYKVSNEPGLGIRIDPRIYAAQSEGTEQIIS